MKIALSSDTSSLLDVRIGSAGLTSRFLLETLKGESGRGPRPSGDGGSQPEQQFAVLLMTREGIVGSVSGNS